LRSHNTATPSKPNRGFRPELQALRALAVAIVVAYHVRPDLLPGGFVGVDVFFVISGFLITGHLLRERTRTGRINLTEFWANRARRILPASLLVIAAVILAAPLVLPMTSWSQLQHEAIASALYVQNWNLAHDAVDYLASTNEPSALQHFWSLAVEEQFYLAWPLVILAATAVGTHKKQLGGPVLLVITVASLVWSVQQVAHHNASAYFSTFTRLWELALGGLLAWYLPAITRALAGKRGAATLPAKVLGLVGVLVVGVSSIIIKADFPFPGLWALPPTLGAAAIIAAGTTRGKGSLSWVVNARPVQWLGNISYSLYLWHFPVLVLYRAWQPGPLNYADLAVMAAAMFGLAHLSYTYVENPVRAWQPLKIRPRVALASALAATMAVSGLSFTLDNAMGKTEQIWEVNAKTVVDLGIEHYGAQANVPASPQPWATSVAAMAPNPLLVGDDNKWLGSNHKCVVIPDATRTRPCEFGDADADVRVALVGDSHARMIGTPVIRAALERGWNVTTYVHNSCPFSLAWRTIEVEGAIKCSEANQGTLAALLADPPDILVTAAWAGATLADGKGDRPGPINGYANLWRQFTERGTSVLAIVDAPSPKENTVSCVVENYNSPQNCAIAREKALKGHDLVPIAAQQVPGVRVGDLTDHYCDADECGAVIGGVAVYADVNHITETFARTLQPYLGQELDAAYALHQELVRD